MMTLDEAIKHCEEIVCKNNECKEDHKQLASWLKELKNLKENKPQNRWKPDSSMLICLEYAIKHINKDGDKRILSKLLEQLKELNGR